MQSYAIKARVALKSVRPKILAGLYQSADYRVQNASQGTNLRTSEDERSAKRTHNAPTKLLPDKGPFEGMTREILIFLHTLGLAIGGSRKYMLRINYINY